MRRASSLLAILGLLLGQIGAQLHDLSDLKHDLAVVRYGEKAPPLGHSIEVCAAYTVICHSVGHSGIWHVLAAEAPAVLPVLFVFFLPRVLRVEFDPRAPPAPASL
ncbi:MAG: hypothetical protein WCA01_12690 [Burkholderiales bacterium]